MNPTWFITENANWSAEFVIADGKKHTQEIINKIVKLGGFKKDPTKIIVVAANTCASASSIFSFALKSFGIGTFVSLVPLDLEQMCVSGGGGSFHTAKRYE